METPTTYTPGYQASQASTSHTPNEALMKAAIAGNKARIDAALSSGANFNAPADIRYKSSMFFDQGIMVKGTTPFLALISNGHHTLAEEYLEKGANIRALTTDSFNALDLTCHNWHPETIKWLAFKQGFSSSLTRQSLPKLYMYADGGAPSEEVMIERRNFITNMSIVNDLKNSDVGLAEALDLQRSAPDLEFNENDILEIAKTLVEYCGHKQITEEITCRGFGSKSSFTGTSCYQLAKNRNLDAVVKYFETLNSQNTGEKMKP